MNLLFFKLKEVLSSVLPIIVTVIILNFTIAPLDVSLIIRFFIGAVLIILGLAIFLCGVDIGISPIGNSFGSTIIKTNKLWIVVIAIFIVGFFVSIAEPSLRILASQVDFVTSSVISKESIVVIASIGVGTMLSLGFVRILYNIPINKVFTILYSIIFILALFTSREFLAISFDASGSTTGAMTIPFILALAHSVSAMKSDSKASEEDSFGLVGIASTGAIMTVMIMSIISKTDASTVNLEYNDPIFTSIFSPFIQQIAPTTIEVILALLPIVIIFLVFQIFSFKLSRKTIRKIVMGLVFAFIGFVLFLVGVNGGFMEMGVAIGYGVATLENKVYLVIVGFFLGFATVLAEPSVYVLIHQIEDVTSGYIKRKVVLIPLAIAVGTATALSMVRILVPGIQLWHYLLPGYVISLVMSYFVPKLFVGIAFDSGGVAAGPMTITFILAFTRGAAEAAEGANVLVDGFGMIAMVALAPLIALQILGFIFKVKSKNGGIEYSDE
ncbi:DUF1538 domain-containing protein [Petrotoga sp. DB-2]